MSMLEIHEEASNTIKQRNRKTEKSLRISGQECKRHSQFIALEPENTS